MCSRSPTLQPRGHLEYDSCMRYWPYHDLWVLNQTEPRDYLSSRASVAVCTYTVERVAWSISGRLYHDTIARVPLSAEGSLSKMAALQHGGCCIVH